LARTAIADSGSHRWRVVAPGDNPLQGVVIHRREYEPSGKNRFEGRIAGAHRQAIQETVEVSKIVESYLDGETINQLVVISEEVGHVWLPRYGSGGKSIGRKACRFPIDLSGDRGRASAASVAEKLTERTSSVWRYCATISTACGIAATLAVAVGEGPDPARESAMGPDVADIDRRMGRPGFDVGPPREAGVSEAVQQQWAAGGGANTPADEQHFRVGRTPRTDVSGTASRPAIAVSAVADGRLGLPPDWPWRTEPREGPVETTFRMRSNWSMREYLPSAIGSGGSRDPLMPNWTATAKGFAGQEAVCILEVGASGRTA
jgi:hypothetical protein